jgi:Ca-activated chloride channel family protein
MFRFEDAWVLGLLPIVPLVYWVAHRIRGGRRSAIRFSAVDTVRESGEGVGRWLPRIPAVLRALALVAFIVALARPQTGSTTEEVTTEGIDIVMAMDVSSSMYAEDLEPNRIEAAKAVGAEFVAGRLNDRIGLVAFAGQAFTQAPLTLDHGVVQALMGELSVGMIEDGTAVGMGLATAVKRLEASDAASRVVILLTDGRSNRGSIGPVTAAQMAEALGVRVYTIGVGTSQGTARVPYDDPLRGRRYGQVEVDVDEPTLEAIAERTGGRYFRATDNESLASIYAEIDELERTEISIENYTQYAERYPTVLGGGLLLLVLGALLSQTALRTLP